jgi:trk system potassium uptake protein TrkH
VRFFVLQRIIGAVIALAGVLMLPPIALSLFDDDGIVWAFAETFAVCVVIGLVLWLPARNRREDLRLRDGFAVTALVWTMLCTVCALPFVLGPTELSFTDAFFESTSGLTTTGATVIIGLDVLPRSLLLYRQSLHLLGGMGIVIFAVAVLPMLRIGGSQLFRAESSGTVRDARLTPRIAETAKSLWLIYAGLVLACAFAYWVAGMSMFDAAMHAFSTVATAGFSTYDASLGHFDSPLIEAIAVLFMLLGGVNFALHFLAWRRATTSVYFGDAEFRIFLAIIVAGSVAIGAILWFEGTYPTLIESLRHGSFQWVANLTTTGLTTEGFADWPGFAPLALILVAFIGGCSGSTAGGMKTVRIMILFLQGVREIRQLVHPRGRFLVKLGKLSVPGAVLAAVTGFCTLYVAAFTVITMILSVTGLDLLSAFSAAASSINNLGPGLGVVASNFRELTDFGTWVCSFAMILGRLEVFTLLVLFTPTFWRE